MDVPLTDNGINEALKAGKRIADVPVDVIYVSDLMRAQMTAMIAMTQHNRGKVPIVQHESPELSSKIFSEKTETDCNSGDADGCKWTNNKCENDGGKAGNKR